MKSIRRSGSRIVIAAATLVVAVVAYADAQGSDARGVTVSERRAAEAEVVGTRAANKLEAALGDAFGGVWIEPTTGHLQVGVTSPASRRAAEAAAERAGAEGVVEEISVRSTWAELEGAQDRWAVRLADLFDRAEVQTALDAEYNAVEVRLGSSVPAARRTAVERTAANDDVDALIVASPRERLGITEQAQCKGFKTGEAFCDPTLVAGVSIAFEAEAKGICTAGPTVRTTDGSTATKATERFALTAGHCVAAGKENWVAWDKKVTKTTIGPGSTYLNSHVADVGTIKIDEASKWRQPGFIPVKPTIAQWAAGETEPIPVVTEQEPAKNAETCISGQTSGKLCGTILATGVTTANKSRLAEVNVTTGGGDSGAPWYAKSYAESPGVGVVEGTHVGLNGKNAAFQPIGIGLEELKKAGLDLELLTQNNEQRAHPVFTSKKYPATVSAKSATSEDEFTAFGVTIKCTENEFHGDAIETNAIAEVTPTYKKCTGPLGVPVVMTANSCKYAYTLNEEVAANSFVAEVDVVCPEGKPGIQFFVYLNHTNQTGGTVMCTVTIPPQFGLGTATMTNSGENIVIDKGAIEGIQVKIHRNNFACPSTGTENETASGVYHHGAVTASATNEGSAVKIDMGGA